MGVLFQVGIGGQNFFGYREDGSVITLWFMREPAFFRVNTESDGVSSAVHFPCEFPTQFVIHSTESDEVRVPFVCNGVVFHIAIVI